jgi:hypothetical protein
MNDQEEILAPSLLPLRGEHFIWQHLSHIQGRDGYNKGGGKAMTGEIKQMIDTLITQSA